VPSPEERTFSLTDEQAAYIDTVVASGTFGSGSETVEKWLRGEVVGVCDAMQADPGRAIPASHVFAAIRSRHADLLKKRAREPQGRFQP
jgi:Arc/MetJ-type ribon-helix-helix transcriptional regulator